jgi:chaperone modulatory protein CbpM
MIDLFSEDEVVTTVTRLTCNRLVRFVEVDMVRPQRIDSGTVYRRIDIARIELLCDLSDDLDLDEAALGVVISLIDQLHAARHDLAFMTGAIDALPQDLRDRISAGMKQTWGLPQTHHALGNSCLRRLRAGPDLTGLTSAIFRRFHKNATTRAILCKTWF